MCFFNISYSCRVSSGNVPSTTVMCLYKSTLRFACVFWNVVSSRFCDRPLLCPATCTDGSLGDVFFTTIVQWSSHPCLLNSVFLPSEWRATRQQRHFWTAYYSCQFISHCFSSQWATRLPSGFPLPRLSPKVLCWSCIYFTHFIPRPQIAPLTMYLLHQRNVDQWHLWILPTSQYTSQ